MTSGSRLLEADSENDALLDALAGSISELPAWQGFLSAACRTFGADHAALIFGPLAERQETDPVFFTDDPSVFETAEGFYRACLGPGETGEAVRRLRLPQPEAGEDLHALALGTEVNRRRVHLLIWRQAGQGGFGEPDRRRLGGLLKPLTRGVRIFEQIVNLERRQIVLNAAIETADIGIILVTADGEPLLSNAVAETLLERKDGLQLVHGRLRAITPSDTASLLSHIRCKAAEQQAESDWQVYTPLALARESNPLPLTVIVRPGPPFRPLKKPFLRTAMLVLRDPGRRPIIPGAALAQLFGLTPAESALASELARGASLDDAAAGLGISRNTARTQLQSVFMKTGVNRQGELVRLLLSSAAALSR